MPTQINIIQWEDWVCVYFDGKLAHYGHSLEGETILELFKLRYDKEYVEDLLPSNLLDYLDDRAGTLEEFRQNVETLLSEPPEC